MAGSFFLVRWITLVTTAFLPLQVAAQTLQPADPQQLLSELRDLHLPNAPAIWPPAPGWWLLAALCCVAAYYVYKMISKRPSGKAGYWRNSALQQQAQLNQQLSQGQPLNQILADASVLMRRVALVSQPRPQTAALQSDSWLQLLDTIGKTDQYSAGVGRLLLSHPYRRHSDIERQQVDELLTLIRETIVNAPEPVADV